MPVRIRKKIQEVLRAELTAAGCHSPAAAFDKKLTSVTRTCLRVMGPYADACWITPHPKLIGLEPRYEEGTSAKVEEVPEQHER